MFLEVRPEERRYIGKPLSRRSNMFSLKKISATFAFLTFWPAPVGRKRLLSIFTGNFCPVIR